MTVSLSSKDFRIERPQPRVECDLCSGSGCVPHASECPECHGTGTVLAQPEKTQ